MTMGSVLCVDDEPRILEGLQRLLFGKFEVTTASSGEEALSRVTRGERFDVVLSDMRMPRMTGAVLLAEFLRLAPDTVRVLLTGQSDMDAAIAAVNEGQIFRFLAKPCGQHTLISALENAVAHHRLITAEKVLLEQTLVGSVRALTEVLALAHPEAFGRGPQRYERARAIAERLGVPDPWHVEVACMLATVGYVVLPNDVTAKLNRGEVLDSAEVEMLAQVPAVAERVLAHIPRLESVKDVLDHQHLWLPGAERGQGSRALPPIGARILRALHDFSVAEAREGSPEGALRILQQSAALYGSDVVEALRKECENGASRVRSLTLRDLRPGMIFATDVTLESGTLLVSRGQRVTVQLLQRLMNFRARRIKEPIPCWMPPEHVAESKA
ncbi:MAG TPA: response regulator [Polyangiaceae bacterium]|nr:response regulator [Polyangiaceae bacterium]